MASIQKTAKGYRAQVAVKGQRDSATFRTKREAEAWASARETELRAQADTPPAQRRTIRDMLVRYRDEVSPKMRGARWELIRINRFLTEYADVAGTRLSDVTPEMFALWRDKRQREVSAGSVIRELGQLSAAFETARREWRWITSNPLSDVRRPSQPEHRDVIIKRWQIKAMLRSLGYSPRQRVSQQRHVVAVLFLFALRTGMRASELCGLKWDRVMVDHVVLPVTKTKPRKVPLSTKSILLLDRMRGWDEVMVFGITASTLDSLFRKYRKRAGLSGFTFHDSRHTAATWMARKLDLLDLCKVFGWSSPELAMIYYNPTPSSIARRLG